MHFRLHPLEKQRSFEGPLETYMTAKVTMKLSPKGADFGELTAAAPETNWLMTDRVYDAFRE